MSSLFARISARDRSVDPEPLGLAALIVSIIAAAASVFDAVRGHAEHRFEVRRRAKSRKALVLRWEANLHEFRDALSEVREVLQTHAQGSADMLQLQRPIDPLTTGIVLPRAALKTYKRLIGRLYSKGKQVSDSTLDLLPELEDAGVAGVLEQSLPEMREHLRRLREMRSLDETIALATEAVDRLLKVAEYMRHEIVG